MMRISVGALFWSCKFELFSHKIGAHVLHVHNPFELLSLNFHTIINYEKRGFSPYKLRYDFSSIKEVDDAVFLFDDMLRMRPLPPFYDFNKLLSLVVKMKQYNVVLHMFDKMRQLGIPSDYTMNIVINSYCLLSRVDFGFAVLGVFFKCGYHPDIITFTTFLKGLLFENKVVEADILFKKLLREKLCEPDEVLFFSPYIIRYDFSSIKEVDDAVFLFHVMLRMQPLPPVHDFTKLLSSLVKMKQYSVALHMFDIVRQLGIPIDEYTMTIVIHSYCLLSRVDFGFAVLGIFFKCGYHPNITTFSTLIKGLFLENKVIEAEILFKKLLREKLCEPDEVMFLTVINGLCKAGQTLTALDLLGLLEKGKCKPNVKAYSTVIDSLCKNGMVDDALKLLTKMIDKGILPDVFTYSSMIQVLCNFGRYEEVKGLLNEMEAQRIFPDVVTFNILVDGRCKEGRAEEAEEMMEIMKQRSISPNIVTYNALIDGYCLRGEMEKAIKVFHIVIDSELQPDDYTYGSLINGYCKKEKVNEAWRLFLEVSRKGLEHTAITYNNMLHGLFHEGRCDDAWKLLNEMQARHVIPDLVTYNILVDGLCRNQQIVKAFSILHLMEDNGIDPKIVTYNSLIEGLCKDGKLDSARNLFMELPSKGLQPDIITFTIIISAFSQARMTKVAKNLLMQMEQCGCLPDSVIYNVLVRGLLKIKNYPEAISLLEEMTRRGFSPDATTTSILLNNFQRQVVLEIMRKFVPKCK